MKVALLALLPWTAASFMVGGSNDRISVAVSLFGGNKGGGDSKGPGMMDQLAMFKKAQEMASKKQKLDQELQQEVFEGKGADGKVTGYFKFVPVKNPMDPNPDYEATKFDFDDEFFESASPEELSAAVQEALKNGIETTNEAVAAKYAVLQSDLMEALAKKD